MAPFTSRQKRTTTPEPAPVGSLPDPLAERIQARVEALEAQPAQTAARRRAQSANEASSSAIAGSPDLAKELDRIRTRLEKALSGLEARMAALESLPARDGGSGGVETAIAELEARLLAIEQRPVSEGGWGELEARLTMIESRTKSALKRSTTAAARSGKVLEALDELARDLTEIAASEEPVGEQLADATDRLRTRAAAVAPPKK